ncbi:MAG: hypothetical protein ACRYGR_06975 [Janthinobacterium lividum]
MPNMTVPDLEACAGVPTTPPVQITATDYLIPYHFQSSAAPAFSLKVLTDLDLEIGNKGGCNMTVRAREPGYVVSVHYAGSEVSTSGPEAACAPLVEECVSHADHTTLPTDYSLKQYLLQGQKK